jgi:hypothetical protein
MLDPSGQFVAMGRSFFVARHEEVRLVWPLPFFIATYPFYRLFGSPGLFVLPIASGALVVRLTGLLAERLRRGRGVPAAIVVGAATPIFAYSVLFWEHLPAVALALGGFNLLLPKERNETAGTRTSRRWAIGTACIAIAAGALRAELYLLLGVVLVLRTLASTRRVRVGLLLLGATVLVSAPLWWLNVASTGHPLPLNAAKNFTSFSTDYLARSWAEIPWHYLVGNNVPRGKAWLFTAAVALVVVLSVRSRTRTLSLIMSGSLACLAVISLTTAGMLETTNCFHGLLLCSPFLAFGGVGIGAHDSNVCADTFVVSTVGLFTLLYVAALCVTSVDGPGAGALELGPRFALILYPLLVARVATLDFPTERFRRICSLAAVLGALVASILFQVCSVQRIHRDSLALAVLKDALDATSLPVVTDVWWVPSQSVALLLTRPAYRTEDDAELSRWIAVAHGLGLRRFIYISFQERTRIDIPGGGTCAPDAPYRAAGLIFSVFACPP